MKTIRSPRVARAPLAVPAPLAALVALAPLAALIALAPLAADAAAAGTAKKATHSKSTAAAHAMAVPFVDDDYAKALAEARARKVPIFIEAWAPW